MEALVCGGFDYWNRREIPLLWDFSFLRFSYACGAPGLVYGHVPRIILVKWFVRFGVSNDSIWALPWEGSRLEEPVAERASH